MAWVLHHDERQTNLVERARWPRRDVVRLAVRQRRSLCRFFPIFHPAYVSRWPCPRSYGGCSVRIVKFLSQEGVLTVIFADSHTGQVPGQALRSVSRPRWAYLRVHTPSARQPRAVSDSLLRTGFHQRLMGWSRAQRCLFLVLVTRRPLFSKLIPFTE